MKRFFGYIRVSTVKQGEHGVSLQEQRDAISAYAQRNALTIVNWFEEKETAAKRGRPIFNRMLRLLKQGKANGVIIHKIDRSARNLKDWADLGELIDSGIEVLFANENLDLNSRGGRLTADIQAVVAADYIRNLREETRKGFYGRLKQGLYPLPAPLGYLDMGKEKAKEPDPLRAPLIRRAFELYATRRFTIDTLVKEMNELGLRNRNNDRVSKTGISVMLNNPFYIGIIRLKSTGETYSGIHKPLISKALFEAVQLILRGKTNAHAIKHDFLFRRLLTCKHCGYSLIGESQKGYVYYRCHTNSCAACVREELIEEAILERLTKTQLRKREIDYLRGRLEKLKANWQTQKKEQIEALELSLSNIQERLDRLTDALIDRLLDKEAFEKRKSALLFEKRSLEERLADLRGSGTIIPNRLSKFLELLENAYIGYKLGLPSEKKEMLDIVTSNRSVDGKNVLIELKLPFQEVANHREFSNGAPHRDRPRRRDKLLSKANTTALDRLFRKLVRHFGSNNEHIISKQ